MMARAAADFALRPFLPADAPLLAEIFSASIEELAAEDYSPEQVHAWIAAAADEAAFGRRLAARLTLVATHGGEPVGFAALEGTERVDLLYVHPAVAGQGVGFLLLDALEKLAVARGAGKLRAEVSDNALDFFTRNGFRPQQRNTVRMGGEWLSNTTMEKPLAAARRAS